MDTDPQPLASVFSSQEVEEGCKSFPAAILEGVAGNHGNKLANLELLLSDDEDEDSIFMVNAGGAAKPAVDRGIQSLPASPLDLDMHEMCKCMGSRLRILWPIAQAEIVKSRQQDTAQSKEDRETAVAVAWKERPYSKKHSSTVSTRCHP